MSLESAKAKQTEKQDTAQAEHKQQNDKLRHSKYYEHDGALRAYANRAMVLAFLCVPIALASLGFAIYVRIQPPTVIRVDANGEAVLLNGKNRPSPGLGITLAQGAETDPTDFEKRAFVRLFLAKYLNFTRADVAINWADSLNMMTLNLRLKALNAMKDDNTVGKIDDDQMNSIFHLRSMEPEKDDPMTFAVFGVQEIHRVRDHKEDFDKVVGEYHIRLVSEKRSESNPSGLLIAEYTESEIEGEKRDAILRAASTELSH
jgi:hypothetical protein